MHVGSSPAVPSLVAERGCRLADPEHDERLGREDSWLARHLHNARVSQEGMTVWKLRRQVLRCPNPSLGKGVVPPKGAQV